jgi:DNA replication protein DnaC
MLVRRHTDNSLTCRKTPLKVVDVQLTALLRVKRLSDFDLGAGPTINPAMFSMLASCSFLSTGEPVVLLGDSGTGKSHLLIGLGMAACEQGRKVRYGDRRATRERACRGGR